MNVTMKSSLPLLSFLSFPSTPHNPQRHMSKDKKIAPHVTEAMKQQHPGWYDGMGSKQKKAPAKPKTTVQRTLATIRRIIGK